MSTPCLHDESVFDIPHDARTDQHSEMTKIDSASEIPHSEGRLIRFRRDWHVCRLHPKRFGRIITIIIIEPENFA